MVASGLSLADLVQMPVLFLMYKVILHVTCELRILFSYAFMFSLPWLWILFLDTVVFFNDSPVLLVACNVDFMHMYAKFAWPVLACGMTVFLCVIVGKDSRTRSMVYTM